jgi:hypothetical protein
VCSSLVWCAGVKRCCGLVPACTVGKPCWTVQRLVAVLCCLGRWWELYLAAGGDACVACVHALIQVAGWRGDAALQACLLAVSAPVPSTQVSCIVRLVYCTAVGSRLGAAAPLQMACDTTKGGAQGPPWLQVCSRLWHRQTPHTGRLRLVAAGLAAGATGSMCCGLQGRWHALPPPLPLRSSCVPDGVQSAARALRCMYIHDKAQAARTRCACCVLQQW